MIWNNFVWFSLLRFRTGVDFITGTRVRGLHLPGIEILLLVSIVSVLVVVFGTAQLVIFIYVCYRFFATTNLILVLVAVDYLLLLYDLLKLIKVRYLLLLIIDMLGFGLEVSIFDWWCLGCAGD